jgi:two-component system LytT family response regulator
MIAPTNHLPTNQLRAYLVDDESLALKRLTRLLKATDRVQIIGSTTDPDEAVEFLSANNVDVLFLDIHLTTMNGFEVLAHLPMKPRVIFTTAYDQYALKAFEVSAIDYLLKPIEASQLERALAKLKPARGLQEIDESVRVAIERIAGMNSRAKLSATNRIWSRSGDKILLIDLTNVSHFYSRDRVTYAATGVKDHIVDFSISTLEEMLQEHDFVRIHRATLLNLAYLDELHRWFGGGLIARLKNPRQTKLTVARTYARSLKAKLGIS